MKRINICGTDYRIPAAVAKYLSEMADELARVRAEKVAIISKYELWSAETPSEQELNAYALQPHEETP